ncbi:hypothetical protein [Streptomyces caatingaensis]|nr:hypothetical protein [Streptomyces caatingaensis]
MTTGTSDQRIRWTVALRLVVVLVAAVGAAVLWLAVHGTVRR